MKKLHYIFLLIVSVFVLSCEEVIEVDLKTGEPRLVIEASIKWQKDTNGKEQIVKLSTTTGFYSTSIPKVSGATVSIKNAENQIFSFAEIPNTGDYKCDNFVPIVGETYTLTVVYKGETYQATETLQSVTKIETITQKNDSGFSGKEYEIEIFFKDPLEKNFYMAKIFPSSFKSPSYSVNDDNFTNGNLKKWIFGDEELKKGNTIAITHYGISEAYYTYMSKIISISSSSGGGSPFQTPPATVRGNIVNQTNINNFALGYFSLGEVDVREFVIE